MDGSMQVVGQKLDEITMKLNAMTEGIAILAEEIKKSREELSQDVEKLADTLDKYIDILTESSRESFDKSRNQLLHISDEINTLTKATGIAQIVRVNNSLTQLLSLLQGAIDPNRIQQQLLEITQFIKSVGGGR